MLPPPAVAALRRYGLAALVFLAVVGLTVSTYQRTLRDDEDVAHRQFQFAAAEQIAHLRDRSDNLVRHVDILRRQLAFAPAEARARFGDIVAPLLARLHARVEHHQLHRVDLLGLDRRDLEASPVELVVADLRTETAVAAIDGLFVGIEVKNPSNAWVELAPRQALGAAPVALTPATAGRGLG